MLVFIGSDCRNGSPSVETYNTGMDLSHYGTLFCETTRVKCTVYKSNIIIVVQRGAKSEENLQEEHRSSDVFSIIVVLRA